MNRRGDEEPMAYPRRTHPKPERPIPGPARRAESDVVRSLDATDPVAVEQFWQGRTSPVIESHSEGHRRVTVLWRSATASAVYVSINRVTNTLEDSALARIAGTDVWHATYVLPTAWRGSYTLMDVDEEGLAALQERDPRWAMRDIREQGQPDPRNGGVAGAYGGHRASVCALDAAPPQPWLTPAPRRGETREMHAPHGRRVWIHTPAGESARPRPLIIALDGEVWNRGDIAANAVDHLAGERAPYVAMIDSGGVAARMRDLAIDGGMDREIVESLLPWLRGFLPISDNPADVIVSGESLGGLTAMKTAFAHPHAVGAALAQSSSLWQDDMIDRARSAAPTRLFLTVGTLESTLLAPHRAMRASGAMEHHDLSYLEYVGGHDSACWRGFWADGVRHLLGIGGADRPKESSQVAPVD